MKHKHKVRICTVANCKEEAEYWVSDLCKLDTFYFCSEHCAEVADKDMENYVFVNEVGNIITKEICIYSCSEKCKFCNY